MAQIGDRSSSDGLALADFPPQFTYARLRYGAAPGFYFLYFPFDVVQFFDGAVDFLAELLPLDMDKGDASNRLRCLDFGSAELPHEALPGLLVAQGHRLELFHELLLLLVQNDYVSEILTQLAPTLGIGDSSFFHIAQIDDVVEPLCATAQLHGQIQHNPMH